MLPRQNFNVYDHVHLQLLDFFLAHPDYDAYWFIEYDVKYTGVWSDLFARYEHNESDFITMHIRPFADEPMWEKWSTFRQPDKPSHLMREECLRSFNVFYRISRSALQFLDTILRDSWYGHPEMLIATLLRKFGFSLLDFGGDGPFTQPGRTNAVYTSCGSRSGFLSPFATVRFRPSHVATDRPEMIYHPVKPVQLREPLPNRRMVYKRWLIEEMNATASHGLGQFAADLEAAERALIPLDASKELVARTLSQEVRRLTEVAQELRQQVERWLGSGN
jgi:hypothetical protein